MMGFASGVGALLAGEFFCEINLLCRLANPLHSQCLDTYDFLLFSQDSFLLQRNPILPQLSQED